MPYPAPRPFPDTSYRLGRLRLVPVLGAVVAVVAWAALFVEVGGSGLAVETLSARLSTVVLRPRETAASPPAWLRRRANDAKEDAGAD
jgi:hypothetical protein